ncbi:hypothetical protein P3X46_004534 [Hevea brasiliensis]|uniref:Uncharacterized protein n=1 Tax=Hevea brasiliensis TaxID=3981 RepID=A0ABQ9MXY1_HEVBR|nr:hypothetical protein P3X46_004534 [Hevea brasiliensis]
MDGLENAPRSLHESAVLSSQDSHPSFESESDSLGRRRLQLCDGKPLYISKETWAKFEQHWNDPKVIQWLEIYSKNRRGAANAHGPSTHIGRSITYAEWSDKLELTLTTPDNINKNQLYLDVVGGGEKRRKVYGLGSELSTFYPLVGASSSKVSTSYNYQNVALQRREQELEKQLEDERQVMTERMDQMKLEMEMNMECMRSSMIEEMMRLVRDLPTLLPPPPQN